MRRNAESVQREVGGEVWGCWLGLVLDLRGVCIRICLLRDFPGGPGLRFRAPNAGDPGTIPGQGTRSHMLQLRSGAE